MARHTARINDRTIGVCYHPIHDSPIITGGRVVTGSGNIIPNQRLQARINDIVLSDCGHIGVICTGKDNVITNQRPTARIYDRTNGYYVAQIITGSSDVVE